MRTSLKAITISFLITILCLVSKQSMAQTRVSIASRDMEYETLFDDVDLTGATTLESAWINISEGQYFSIFIEVNTDSTYYTDATNDSLGFDIDYTLAPGNAKPASSNDGWWLKDSTNAVEIMSLAIADTVNNMRFYQSFHNNSPSGSNMSPAHYAKFFIDKDAAHVTEALDLRIKVWLVIQP